MLSQKQLNQVCCLWDWLTDFDAGHSNAALFHLMKTVGGWIGADNGMWVGSVRLMRGKAARRDLLRGWRGCVVQYWLKPPELVRRSRQAAKDQDTSDPGMTTMAVAKRAGAFRSYRLQNGSLVNLAKFKRTAHYQNFYEGLGIADRIWVAFPVNGDAESYFLFDRHRGRKPFSQKDEELAAFVLRGIKWFHRHLMLHYGLLVAGKALTSTEQKILPLLLTDKSEKEIAEELGQSFHTTHWYVTEIYRKFGVNGRAALMALWLGSAK